MIYEYNVKMLTGFPKEEPHMTDNVVNLGIGIIQRDIGKVIDAMCREFEIKDLRITVQITKDDFVDVDIHEITCALPPNDFQGRLMRAVRSMLPKLKKQDVKTITIRARINYADKRVITVLAHQTA